ncbi:MAG TPA: hypothetical protein VL866_21565, partial [Pyrinomonadaceae bacterium]|nr:hypothetical protein [Pyrinomonadaceae bacterium]
MFRRVVLLIVLIAVAAAGIWGFARYKNAGRSVAEPTTNVVAIADADAWSKAIERVKEDRGESAGGPIEIPTELRHYSDRHWFLATQVAEVEKQRVQTCQDFIELAGMIQRGEMVSVPAVTDTYVLFGVGAQADGELISRYENDENIELYGEGQFSDAHKRIEEQRSSVQADIKELNKQLSALNKRDREKRSELQKQIGARQQDLQAVEEDKTALDDLYAHPQSRQRLFRYYEFIRTFANNFGGRSYNIDDSADRQALKVGMLRSLRPPAKKIMEQIAAGYHQQFNRP